MIARSNSSARPGAVVDEPLKGGVVAGFAPLFGGPDFIKKARALVPAPASNISNQASDSKDRLSADLLWWSPGRGPTGGSRLGPTRQIATRSVAGKLACGKGASFSKSAVVITSAAPMRLPERKARR